MKLLCVIGDAFKYENQTYKNKTYTQYNDRSVGAHSY